MGHFIKTFSFLLLCGTVMHMHYFLSKFELYESTFSLLPGTQGLSLFISSETVTHQFLICLGRFLKSQ